MEMSSRLVRARALLGKWKAGLQEVRSAHSKRNMEELASALSKWSFSEDDPDVASAKQDLERWQSIASALPQVLREAVENRDVEQIRETINELNSSGPAVVEGSEHAQKMLVRYSMQARALDDAVASCNYSRIQIAMQTWEFGKEDPHALEARGALQKRSSQKAVLRAAVQALDGEQLREAVGCWGFEKGDEDYVAASEVLQRYKQAAAELERMAKPPADLVGLSSAVAAWEFAQGDAALEAARARLSGHELDARNALLAADGWALQRVWNAGGQGKALAGSNSLLRDEVAEQLRSYGSSVSKLRGTMRAAGANSAGAISEQVFKWEYSEDDPHVEAARMWLHLQSAMEARRLDALKAANESGQIAAVRGAMSRLPGTREDRQEVKKAKSIAAAFDAALESTGELALGADPGELKRARERYMVLTEAERDIHEALSLVDPRWFTEVKSMGRSPHRLVHGVLQVSMHVVAGLNPNVRDPPRDLDWRSCQRMVLNVQQFVGNLAFVPAWIASGKTAGIHKARAHSRDMLGECGSDWSVEGVRMRSPQAARLLEYLERVFAYLEAFEERCESSVSSPLDSEPEGASPPDSPKQASPKRRSLEKPGPLPGVESRRRQSTHANFLSDHKAEEGHCARRLSTRLVWRSRTVPADLEKAAAEMPMAALGAAFLKADLALDTPNQLVKTLRKARKAIGGNPILAAAWVIAGGDTRDLDSCVGRARKHMAATWARACVAHQVLSATALPSDPLISKPTSSAPSTSNQRASSSRSKDGASSRGGSKDGLSATPSADPLSLNLAVKLISGEEVARVAVSADATAAELKRAITKADGTPEKHQRLMHGMKALDDQAGLVGQGVAQGGVVTLIRMSGTLSEALDKASSSLSACGPRELDAPGPRGPPVSEPAAYLLFGVAGDSLADRPRKGQPHGSMLLALRTASEVLREVYAMPAPPSRPAPLPPPDAKGGTRGRRRPRAAAPVVPAAPPWALRLCSDSVLLDDAAVRSLKIPQVNLSAAWRALASSGAEGIGAQATADFLTAMQRFYSELVPRRAFAATELAAAEEAERAFRCTLEAAALGSKLTALDREPHCRSAEDVGEASHLAAEQVEAMAHAGLALPAMHVEYIRMAVDSAGSELLEHPPMASHWDRLQWTEAAVSCQLAPLPHLSNALAGIARGVGAHQLEDLARGAPPDVDGQRLLAAVVWAVEPTCSSESPWEMSCRLLLAEGSGEAFAERLATWEPIRNAVAWRLARARELLFVIWGWVAAGCGGVPVLAALFSWVSLAVAMSPLAEQAQQLQPVHVAVKKGISRVERAPGEKRQDASAKAWTNVLFVIDSPEKSQEDWWWLKLIRPLAIMDPPWPTDEGLEYDDAVIRQPGPASWRRGSVHQPEKAKKKDDEDNSPLNTGEDSPFTFDQQADEFDSPGDRLGAASGGSSPCFMDVPQAASAMSNRTGEGTPPLYAELREPEGANTA